MANYKILVPFILESEGGYVNNPHDRGGETNKGVTMQTWRAYCAKKGKPAGTATLKAMRQSEWEEIFTSLYWNKLKADRIADQSIANLLADFAWGSGVTRAAKTLQTHLGVTADGIVGDITLKALNSRSPLPLFGALKQARLRFVESIVRNDPTQKIFLKGWTKRINRIIYGSPYFTS